ncbi:MAG TPA: hypothetical protein VM163_12780 [bacterium]|nr:hypothetical protein [bacterium]
MRPCIFLTVFFAVIASGGLSLYATEYHVNQDGSGPVQLDAELEAGAAQ